jgi:hypothetical protein
MIKHFYAIVLEMDVAIHQLALITTDIAPAMISENIDLIGLCNKHSALHFISITIVLLFLRRPYLNKISFQQVMSALQKL